MKTWKQDATKVNKNKATTTRVRETERMNEQTFISK